MTAAIAQALLASARRVTIKVGSSLLSGPEGARSEWLTSLGHDIAQLRAGGRQVVLVSSGAVALGRDRLSLPRSPKLDLKQAAAAAGQPLLMQAWSDALAPHRLLTAQLLLTFSDTESRRSWLNARATMERLLTAGAVPVVNENDSVATEELRYGDNDRLSARVAQMVQSDLLILLSDIDGLYSADPRKDPGARHIGLVDAVTPEVMAQAGPASPGGVGTGGMRTKLEAANLASRAGCTTIIASGALPRPISALERGDVRATVVTAQGSPASAYKRWIAGSLRPAGTLLIDAGAAEALRHGRSLLPAGVRDLTGAFGPGDCIGIVAEGTEIARGLVRYGAEEVGAIKGARASDIERRLGYSRGDVLVHRDDLVLT